MEKYNTPSKINTLPPLLADAMVPMAPGKWNVYNVESHKKMIFNTDMQDILIKTVQ